MNIIEKIKLYLLLKRESDAVIKEINMNGKDWWTSKAVWTAIVGAVLTAVTPVTTALGHPIEVPDYAYKALAAFGLYAIRDGVGKPLN